MKLPLVGRDSGFYPLIRQATSCLSFQDWLEENVMLRKKTSDFCNQFCVLCLVGRVFANGPRNLDSIPGRVIPKTLKMVLDISLLNSQQYMACIKGKVKQSWERSRALPYTSVL